MSAAPAPPASGPPRLAVIGGGWAGIAAAVEATRAGRAVSLFEMGARLGGRARRVDRPEGVYDNGQHILIGAYSATLSLMRAVGVDTGAVLLRRPLSLVDPAGRGLVLREGPALTALCGAILRHPAWSPRDRLGLMATALRWWASGFRCDPTLSVATLCAGLRAPVRQALIDPLCVAALNTPSDQASASVFLRVLRDALFSGRGGADLLLPRASLDALLPAPAQGWLLAQGATVRLGHRVMALVPHGPRWRVDGETFDSVILATPPGEAARLIEDLFPAWASLARGIAYEPILTVYADSPGTRLASPMVALPATSTDADLSAPAQFVFDLGQLGGPPGRLAFVASAARPWLERGLDLAVEAVLQQGRRALHAAPGFAGGTLAAVHAFAERRATFACTPGLRRTPSLIAPGLVAAGDHVAGPYPATLEGAVRSAHVALGLLTARPAGASMAPRPAAGAAS